MPVPTRPSCPDCKNVNIVEKTDPHNSKKFTWCRNCGWTSDNRETPRLASTR